MKLYLSPSHDPAYNLAAEEYLLTNSSDECVMLWTSEPSVIIGKFQNPYAEVSLTECERRGIGVFRRNSGGGTVYHDRGNLNYTVFSKKSENSPDYKRFLTPVFEFLATLGICAEIRDTSALFVNNKKISGSAQSVVGERVMHHGTLLFDAYLPSLSSVTGHASGKIISKAIRSNPSPVTNIRDYLINDMDIDEFTRKLGDFLGGKNTVFDENEKAAIESLADEKYRSFEWVYGRTPRFTLSSGGVEITSSHGIIESCSLFSEQLAGERLLPDVISQKLSGITSQSEIIKLITNIFD